MLIPEYGKRSVGRDALDEFSVHIGQMILNLAMADQALDFLLMEVFELGKKANVVSKMPRLLGQKIGALQKIFERVATLQQYEGSLRAPLRAIDEGNELRNHVAHGAITHYEATPIKTLYFARLDYNRDSGVHHAHDVAVPLPSLITSNMEVADAVASLHAFLLAHQNKLDRSAAGLARI